MTKLGVYLRRMQPWLELVRLPQLFVVAACALSGALVAGAGLGDVPLTACVMAAAVFLHAGGAVFRGLCDYKRDLAKHPSRPLPAKRVLRRQAMLVCFILLAVGGIVSSTPGPNSTQTGLLILISIALSELLLKDNPVAMVLRAARFSLYVLLGMTLVAGVDSPAGWALRGWLLAAVGFYALAAMMFARADVHQYRSDRLTVASLLAGLSVLAIAAAPAIWRSSSQQGAAVGAAVLLGILAYPLARAVLTPTPRAVQRASQISSFALIALAAVVACVTRSVWLGFLVLAFLVPAIKSIRYYRPEFPPPAPAVPANSANHQQ